jgi:hypothetical protein
MDGRAQKGDTMSGKRTSTRARAQRPSNATAAVVAALEAAAEAAASGAGTPSPALWRSITWPRGYSAASEERTDNVAVRIETDVPLRPEGGRGPSVAKVYNSLITNRLRPDGASHSDALYRRVGWALALRAPIVEANGRCYVVADRGLIREAVAEHKRALKGK